MPNPLRKLFSRRLQATLCLLAVAMQISAPALHEPHAPNLHPEVAAAGSAGVLLPAHEHAGNDAAHDAASCSQCRLVSQLKSLAPLTVVAAAPAVESKWLAAPSLETFDSRAGPGSGAPRAPPPLA